MKEFFNKYGKGIFYFAMGAIFMGTVVEIAHSVGG